MIKIIIKFFQKGSERSQVKTGVNWSQHSQGLPDQNQSCLSQKEAPKGKHSSKYQVKSATGSSLPQEAQEGAVAVYTRTEQSSHSHLVRASLDDEINPNFRFRHPLPLPLPASLLWPLSQISHRQSGPFPSGFTCPASQGQLRPLPKAFLSPTSHHHALGCPSQARGPGLATSKCQVSQSNNMEATWICPGRGRGRPGTPQAPPSVSCHSCPERGQEVWERAGVGRDGPSLLGPYISLPEPHSPKLDDGGYRNSPKSLGNSILK